jgi:hypothetical protein
MLYIYLNSQLNVIIYPVTPMSVSTHQISSKPDTRPGSLYNFILLPGELVQLARVSHHLVQYCPKCVYLTGCTIIHTVLINRNSGEENFRIKTSLLVYLCLKYAHKKEVGTDIEKYVGDI